MYFITSIKGFDKYGSTGSRTFGYYETYWEADHAVKRNTCDIHEYVYDYAVIEEIEPGIHAIAEKRWFYKFNHDYRIYSPIEEPEEAKGFINFSIG